MKKIQSICHGLTIVFCNIILLEPWLIMANDSKNTIRSKGAENIWKHCQNINGDFYSLMSSKWSHTSVQRLERKCSPKDFFQANLMEF